MAAGTGTTAELAARAEPLFQGRRQRTLWGDAFRQFRRHRMAMLGLIVFSFLVVATLIGPAIYPKPINDIDLAQKLHGPSLSHPFGTDDLGQDILARVLFGGRVSIAVGLVAMLISVTIGTLLGALAGFFGGFTDVVIMRITEVMLSLPQLPLLLLVIYLFRDKLRHAIGPELGTFTMIVVIIGALAWMRVARLVRASFLSIKEKEYIEAARSVGVPSGRLMIVHMLPNALSPVIVAASLGVAAAILTESALSFLGLGFPPDLPTWGRILYDAKDRLDTAPYWAMAPGICIFLAILSINFIGDGLRDALDPRRTSQ
ncbi:MAG TPA: ABC transporter permease [Dehalococcoidia bacterium]|nr:ABC transporter permease [Dehalococcoidia bacterium]